MPRMTDTERELWKTRLLHADRVWESYGLVADRVGSKRAMGPKAEEIWHYLRAYRGDQWCGPWGGIPQEALSTTTMAFSAYNSWASGLLARNPRVQVLPRMRSGSPHALEVAKDAIVVEALLNYDIHVQKMRRQWNQALFSAFFAPFGCVRHGFTPVEEVYADDGSRIEHYAMAEPERPWIRFYAPWDVRFDPLARSFEPDEDCRWGAFRQMRSLEEIRRNPNLRTRRDLKPNVRLSLSASKLLQGEPTVVEMVESWVVYDLVERKWFEIVHELDKPLREPENFPIPWKDGPWDVLFFNPQMDTPFPVPYFASVWPTVQEKNKLRTIEVELVKRLRRVVGVNKEALADREWEKLEDADLVEFLATRDGISPGEVFAQVQLGGFPSELLGLESVYNTDIREALGQSQFARAQRANVETAAEAQEIARGDAVIGFRNQERLDDFLSSCVRHYAIARQATATESEFIPITGREDVALLMDNLGGAPYFRVTPEQLRREYDYQIEAGSSAPDSRQGRAAMAASMLNLWGANPAFQQHVKAQQVVLEFLLAAGKNPASYMLSVAEMQRMAAAQQGIPGMETPRPQPGPDQTNLVEAISAIQRGRGNGVAQ